MIMFFTSISKFDSSLYLSTAFQLNVGCFSVGLNVLGIMSTDLVVFTDFSASLTAIIAAVLASMVACVIAWMVLCSAAILFLCCCCCCC